MAKNISLLLGAGISIPAGLPSTMEITEILQKSKVKYLTETDYFKLIEKKNKATADLEEDYSLIEGPAAEIANLRKYLQIISRRIESFYSQRKINYEDIFYVTTQVRDFLREYENPVVADFVTDLIKDFTDLVPETRQKKRGYLKLYMADLAELAANYIQDTTVQALYQKKLEFDYLDFIKELLVDPQTASLNIFTLNHDLLLEDYLLDREISYYDGFTVQGDSAEIRVWQPDFLHHTADVHLLKLHGSINWYKFIDRNIDKYRGYYFAAINRQLLGKNIINNGNMASLSVLGNRPLILTGRFNKILEYNRSIYVDLHYNFYSLLPRTSILLVTGYSFNDKGINSWLIDWMYSSTKHRMVLIHPQPEKCLAKAGTEIKKNWSSWQQADQLIYIPISIEKFSWRKYSQQILG